MTSNSENSAIHSLEVKNMLFKILLFLAGTLFGLIPVLSTILHQAGYLSNEIIFLRLTISGLIASVIILLGSLANKQVRPQQMITKQDVTLVITQSVLLILMIYVYIMAIAFDISSGEAALLVQIQPIVTIILSYVLFKEVITTKQYLAVFSALLGVLLLTRPWQFSLGGSSLMGDLLALSNGIFYSFYLVTGRFYASNRKKHESTGDKRAAASTIQRSPLEQIVLFSYILLIAGLLNIVITTILNIWLVPTNSLYPLLAVRLTKLFDPQIVILTLVLAIFCTVTPYALIALSSRRVSGAQLALLLLMEPVSATLLGWLCLGQNLTVLLILGGFCICIAVLLASTSRKKI